MMTGVSCGISIGSVAVSVVLTSGTSGFSRETCGDSSGLVGVEVDRDKSLGKNSSTHVGIEAF